MIFILSALAAPVDLSGLYNHDLFVTERGKTPYFLLKSGEATPELWGWSAARSPDIVLLAGREARDAPRSVSIPVGQAGAVLSVVTAGQGGLELRDVVADGTVVYTSGRTQALKWLAGEHAWPAWAGATGRGASALKIGKNVHDQWLTASWLTVDLAWPEDPVSHIELRSRASALAFGVIAVSLDAAPPTVQARPDRTPAEGYAFSLAAALPQPMPGAPAVSPRDPVTGRLPRIRVEGEHLVDAAGRRARLWGVNLIGEGALPSPELAETIAVGLRNDGYNLVRLHHIDHPGAGLVNPDRGKPGVSPTLADGLDRLDRFVAALGEAGVYVTLEGLTRREFLAGEGVPFPDGVPAGNKYVSAFWPEWLAAEQDWLKTVYGRVNPHTGLTYGQDPTVAFFELSNENSLVTGWSMGALERLPGGHRTRLDLLWNGYLSTLVQEDRALEERWVGTPRGGLQAGESLRVGSVSREPSSRQRTDLYPTRRGADLVAFYQSLEAERIDALITFVRTTLGMEAPLVCNTSFLVPAADRLLGRCDVIDTHHYWDPIAETHVFSNTSVIADPRRSLERFSACQLGKPCVMTELNHSWPNRFGVEAPLFWAAMTARQDFDAVVWFGWRHAAWRSAPDGPDGALDLEARFNHRVQSGVASKLFREGLVAAAPATYVRWWSEAGAQRDLAEAPGLWHEPLVGWQSALDYRIRSSYADEPPDPRGDDGDRVSMAPGGPAPLGWSPMDGSFVIDLPAFQAWIGPPRSPGAQPTDLRVYAGQFVAASWVSLGAEPVTDGESLLTVVGRCERQGTLWSTGSPGLIALGTGPARLETLRGTVRVRRGRGGAVWALGPDGSRLERVRPRKKNGWMEIHLDELATPWLLWTVAG